MFEQLQAMSVKIRNTTTESLGIWNGLASIKSDVEKIYTTQLKRALLSLEAYVMLGTSYSITDLGFTNLI